MTSNYLILPLIEKIRPLNWLRRYILQVRWLVVALIILVAFWFKLKLGESYILVKIGMISFAAALQFAPVIIGGLFWKKGNKAGAILGMSAGFLVWAYTSLIPAFVHSGWLTDSLLNKGPGGISWLRPEGLLGITNLEPLAHTILFTMLVNIGLYILGSLLVNPDRAERETTDKVFEILAGTQAGIPAQEEAGRQVADIHLEDKKRKLLDLLKNYLEENTARNIIGEILTEAGLSGKSLITVKELADLHKLIERTLAGYIGAPSASEVMARSGLISAGEERDLSTYYGRIIADLKLTPRELSQKIDYYREKEELLKKQSRELENQVKTRTKELREKVEELENQKLATMNILEDVHESQEELKNAYETLKKRRQELEALKSLSDELTGILDLGEATKVFDKFINEVLDFSTVTYLILNPAEEGGLVYTSSLKEEVNEKYLDEIEKDLEKFLASEKNAEMKNTLILVRNLKPKMIGKKLNNEIGVEPKSRSIFPLKFGEQTLGLVYFTSKKAGLDFKASSGLTDALIVTFTLFVARLQTLIRSQHSRTESLVKSLTDGVIMFNNDMNIVLMNPTASKYTGISKEGFSFDDFYKLFSEYNVKELIGKAVTTGETSHLNEVQLVHYYYEMLITPVKDNEGGIVGGAIIIHDITYLKEIDRMKTEFVSVASHQLRTPLTAIKLFTEMLLRGDVGELKKEQFEYLNNIFQSTERMARLVNDLLNVTRIESGRMKIDPQPTRLDYLIINIINETRPLASIKEVEISFDRPKTKFLKIPIDTNLFRQVIHNLVVNAIRYSDPKRGRIIVKLSKYDKDNYIISVTDNGIGIPENVQSRIFHKFFRADNAIKIETEGTGLGLYVSKMIVETSGGKIWFESVIGKGTTFYVTVPIKGMPRKKGERGLIIS